MRIIRMVNGRIIPIPHSFIPGFVLSWVHCSEHDRRSCLCRFNGQNLGVPLNIYPMKHMATLMMSTPKKHTVV